MKIKKSLISLVLGICLFVNISCSNSSNCRFKSMNGSKLLVTSLLFLNKALVMESDSTNISKYSVSEYPECSKFEDALKLSCSNDLYINNDCKPSTHFFYRESKKGLHPEME